MNKILVYIITLFTFSILVSGASVIFDNFNNNADNWIVEQGLWYVQNGTYNTDENDPESHYSRTNRSFMISSDYETIVDLRIKESLRGSILGGDHQGICTY